MYRAFLQAVENYYVQHGRHDLPWRVPEASGRFDPYKILVSEVMLQQTQVPRVIPKFHDFSQRFPSVAVLAQAPLGDVLIAWQGLGYNRRAKYLWHAAQKAAAEFGGTVPNDQLKLESLLGIGANTAGAIRAYAFNEPVVFVETNIRTVYIHHFFQDKTAVPDAAIRELVEQTLDKNNSRRFYWSLMDYGTYLKQTIGNISRASKGYTKQSQFSGSLRQIRGKVLHSLVHGAQSEEKLLHELNDDRAARVLADLVAEGLIIRRAGSYKLP